jgi:hypothetical protein
MLGIGGTSPVDRFAEGTVQHSEFNPLSLPSTVIFMTLGTAECAIRTARAHHVVNVNIVFVWVNDPSFQRRGGTVKMPVLAPLAWAILTWVPWAMQVRAITSLGRLLKLFAESSQLMLS